MTISALFALASTSLGAPTTMDPRNHTGGEALSPYLGIPFVILFIAFLIWRFRPRS